MNLIDLAYIERRIDDAKMVVIDTETTGLDWRRDKTVGFVLTFSGDPRDSFYLPVRHAGSGNFDPDRVITMLRRSLRRQSLKVAGFVLGFDMKFLHNDGIEVTGPLEDGQINAFLIDERQRSFSLDACCKFMNVREKLGEPLYRHMASIFGGEPTRNAQMKNYHRLAGDDPIGVDYAVGDGTSTWQLIEAQQPVLDEQDLRRVWEVECRVIRVLHRMAVRGIKVDEERLHQVRGLVARELERTRNRLPKDFNVGAPSQLKKLFTDAGITDWPTTGKGNASFAEPWLMTTPLGQDIVAVRKLQHLEDSFLRPLIERHLWNGRVHSTYNQTRGEEYGTVTGRLSSSDPNMQQIPKHNEVLGSLFRSIYVPDPGMIWGSPDLNQAEPRLLAHYGEVKVLLSGFLSNPPIDAHTAVARAANIPRQSGKTLNMALLTGAGNNKAAAMLNLPMDDAMRIVDQYFSSMPEIRYIQRRAANVMEARGYVKSILGRRARLEDRRFSYKALNRLLQCGCADIIKKAMADVDEYLRSEGDQVFLVNSVHDSLDITFPSELRYQYDKSIEMLCDFGPGRSILLAVPMVADAKEGPDWGAASYGVDIMRKSFRSLGGDYDGVRKAA